MNKFRWWMVFILLGIAGCGSPVNTDNLLGSDDSGNSGMATEMTYDADGFVRYPGEPTRETTKYVIVEDICGQFTAEFMAGVTGHKIIKAENPYPDTNIYTCHYTYEKSDSADLLLVLDYLSAENQKKGQEFLDRTVVESDRIPMKNMVVYQEDGNINSIYFVLNDNKLLTLNRGSGTAVGNDELLDIAVNIGKKIKNYE